MAQKQIQLPLADREDDIETQSQSKTIRTLPVEEKGPGTEGDCISHRSSRNSVVDIPQETMEASGGTEEMDHFLQRMKTDLMHELKSIQHGEKPVTGQNNREQIQKFMEKYIPTERSQENPCSSSRQEEVVRPEAVVVEVQGVIEQRRVSSVLQSASFRRQLENVIRGSIQSTHRRATPVPRPRNRLRAAPSGALEDGVPQIQTRPVPPEVTTATPEPRLPAAHIQPSPPRLSRQDSTDSVSSVDSFSSARSSADFDLHDEELEADTGLTQEVVNRVETPQSINLPNIAPTTDQQSVPAPETNRHANRPAVNDTGYQNLTWNDINRVHREELVDEISDLLHSRLVSSTLEGEFRATLELLVQDRVESSGHNGQAVQELIRNLPQGGVVHNDFTHLGIPNPDMDNVDNISVTSVSAHSVPYAQTNTHLSREIHSLKAQMLEMKNMLKLTFDLQMDIQRAVRQEVAAAMHSINAQGATAAPVRSSQPVNDTHCLICLDRHSDSVLYQCGHMCVCYICGKDLISRNLGCPVCRAPIKDVIRAYKTNVE